MIRRLLSGMVAAVCGLVAVPGFASAGKKQPAPPRADFHAACPFAVPAPSVVAVLDGKRWQQMLSAARAVPPPYEPGATDFRRQSIVVVALRHTPTPITQGALYAKRPQRFDPQSGTLTLWYEVKQTPVKEGEMATTVIGEPCFVTWVARRSDLRRIVARTTDGRVIAAVRVATSTEAK